MIIHSYLKMCGFSKNEDCGIIVFIARVAKLADALALGASAARHEGSSPFPGTKSTKTLNCLRVFDVLWAERCFCLSEAKGKNSEPGF